MSEREGEHYRGDHIEFRDSDIHGEVTGVRYEHHHHYPPPAQPAAPGEPLGRLIGQIRALDLEVHPAIDAGAAAAGLDVLPAYIPRTHDEMLTDLVARVGEHGDVRMRVLVGGSSTGKTRACWETVRELPAPWRLWHPLRPDRPDAALAELQNVGPHTVVWLNEAQHYLLTPVGRVGEQVAAALRELLAAPERGPVLVLGTLWPDYWDLLTAVPKPGSPDPHTQARELLKGTGLRIPETFTGPDLQAAHASAREDPRLAEALGQAQAGALTQYLAGGPALLERYDTASVAVRALVHAAMDARRLGHGRDLPRLFLEEAAAGYLSDEQWDLLADDWLEQAFAYLTNPLPCRGARAPLTRVKNRPSPSLPPAGQREGEPSYRLADYLEQHGNRTRRSLCPPAGFWDAATHHATGNHTTLAQAAYNRGRYRHAFALWQPAADAGDTSALRKLAEMRERTGDRESAERLARAAADAGNTYALWELAWIRERTGDREGAEQLYREAADAGDTSALRELARIREQAGDQESAEQLARAAADAGDTSALRKLAEIRERTGDQEGAEQLYRAAANAGNTSALRKLAEIRERTGDREGAERLAHAAADAGDTYALRKLARIRERTGDREGTEQLYRAAADAGDTSALWELAEMWEEAGDRQGAERLAHAAADAGNTSALRELARIREQAGDRESAERLAHAAADAGDTSALWELAEMWERAEGSGQWGDLLRFGLEADGRIADAW